MDLSSSFSFFGNFGFEKKTESSVPHSKEFYVITQIFCSSESHYEGMNISHE